MFPDQYAPGVYVQEVPSSVHPIAGASTSTAGFLGVIASTTVETPQNKQNKTFTIATAILGIPVLCTSFAQFEKTFGTFSKDTDHNYLAHAVYGFFNNGGTLCYVAVVLASDTTGVEDVLAQFDAIDDISLLAMPTTSYGTVTSAAKDLLEHCANMKNRFAILDADKDAASGTLSLPSNSPYGAFYYPWIQVFDPPTSGLILVPPSGHVAGVYAQTDNDRGVWKAPANVVVNGALDVAQRLTDAQQGPLNSNGINVIRNFSGDVTVWGARTMADSSTDSEWTYVNVRRFFIFLEQSIREGTRWVVFEPNEPSLWAKITRNVTAFLTNLWRAGAMAGSTPQEAFFVQCDASNNPPELQETGQVVTRIGVAPAYPAEFVVFEISLGLGP